MLIPRSGDSDRHAATVAMNGRNHLIDDNLCVGPSGETRRSESGPSWAADGDLPRAQQVGEASMMPLFSRS